VRVIGGASSIGLNSMNLVVRVHGGASSIKLDLSI